MSASRIHVVPSFHYDVVYLKDYESYKLQSFQIIDEALAMLEEFKDYTFTIEQVILLEAYWEARPESREPLKRFAKEGRLQVAPGMYVMPDMNMPDGESMFLQALCGFEWLERTLGFKPDVCWIADCWGHHAQLPQILSQCGYKYYAFWRCMSRDLKRNHFLWKGLDGTSLKSHWLSKGYGSIIFPTGNEVVNAPDLELFGCSPQQVKAMSDGFEALGSGGVAMLCDGGDFMRPQKSAPASLEALRASGLFKEVSFSHPRRYLEALDWSSAPSYEGEFNSAFQGTFSSNVAIKQGVRKCAFLLNAAERLSVLSGKEIPDYGALLKSVLKQQFHDTISGTIADAPLKDTLKELAASAKALKAALSVAGKGAKAWLFNPLQFERTELVKGSKGYSIVSVKGLSCAKASSAERLNSAEGAVFPASFENPFYSATLGKDGFISSLKEKGSGAELVNGGSAFKFGAVTMQLDYGDLWLHFDSPLNGGCLESALTQNAEDPLVHPASGSLVNRSSFKPCVRSSEIVHSSPELLVVRQRGDISFWKLKVGFVTETTLRKDSPRIEFRTEVLPGGRHFRLRAAFPTSIGGDGEVNHEVAFGVQSRGRACHAAQNWMDFSSKGGSSGLALLNRGIPSNGVDKDGNMLLTLFRSAAMEYKAPSEGSFNEGVKHVFDYAIVPHGRRDFAAIVKEGLLFNFPLTEAKGDYAKLEEPSWSCVSESVFISGMRKSGEGVFVRVYEGAGEKGGCELKAPASFKEYAEADGLQKAAGPFKPLAGALKLSLRPFEIKGLLFR